MDSVHQNTNKAPLASTQLYLRIAEIHDNVVVLKNGGLRVVLSTSSVNVNLKSEDEQNALAFSYQSFLNSLEFPIQTVVRSRKLDISKYLEKLHGLGKTQTSELMKNQVVEYTEYVRRLVEFADIMEKQFYVVVPYDPPRATGHTLFQKFWNYIHPSDSTSALETRRHEFAEIVKGLNQRVDNVRAGLENCGLHVTQLTTPQLIELFYDIYNPLTARNEKLSALADLHLTTENATPVMA